MRKITLLLLTVVLGTFLLLFIFSRDTGEQVRVITTPESTLKPETTEVIAPVAQNLEIPWEIEFLPGGDILVTERPGRLVRIGNNQQVIEVEGVAHIGEGGLQGMALHPDFENNNYIYLYLTTRIGLSLTNRVERYRFDGDGLSGRRVIIEDIPGNIFHDGGRLSFGPDGKLYITTGDAGQPALAQVTESLAGKILRLNDDGSIPSDNPFGNAVFSYGHRNPQGLAWDGQGRLWATEHGPSGAQSGFDELNLIEKGGNYGWPVIRGAGRREDMISPVIQSGADETWAPAGAAFLDNSVFFAGLKGETLYEYKIDEDRLNRHFTGQFGRLRAVTARGDFLYLTTSNTDGRGGPQPGDDKIIKLALPERQ